MKNLLAFGGLAVCMLAASCMKDENDDNVTAQDKAFVREITLSNRSEISLANLALAKATDASVRNYAQMMITDHTMAETQLNEIAGRAGMSRATDSLNAMASSLRPVLMGLSGRSFDSAYIVSQIPAHQMARTINEEETRSGNNEELRNYAQMMLPKIQTHLIMADTIAARLR
jgi:putative membrane protein